MILGFIEPTPWYLRLLGFKARRRREWRVSQDHPNEPARFAGFFYQDAPKAS